MTPQQALDLVNDILNRNRCQHTDTRLVVGHGLTTTRCYMTAIPHTCYCQQHQPPTPESE
jgi:hypothetical protein